MNDNLMELVGVCEPERETYTKTDENLERAGYLEQLGFRELSQNIIEQVEKKDKLNRITEYGYLKITTAKIKEFLKKKVELYNSNSPKKTEEHSRYIFTDRSMRGYLVINEPMTYGGIYGMATDRHRLFPNPYEIPENSFFESQNTISERTNDFYERGEGKIGQFVWNEVKIENYKKLPPQHILDILAEHKSRNVFDYFTIASVEHIEDPLLLGRLKDSEDRYFIAQWGSDIALEDVI